MIQRIKDALNSSYIWLLFLLGCIAYFWRKEKDLENELAETKADGRIKDEEEQQGQLDHVAANAVDEYERIRGDYLRERDSKLRQGDTGTKGPDQHS